MPPLAYGVPGQPAAQGGASSELRKQATTWLVVGVLTLCCGSGCLFGPIGAIFCFIAMQSADQGKLEDAAKHLKLGRTLIIVGLAVTALLFALGIVLQVLGVLASAL